MVVHIWLNDSVEIKMNDKNVKTMMDQIYEKKVNIWYISTYVTSMEL